MNSYIYEFVFTDKEEWLDPLEINNMFFTSHQECCDTFFVNMDCAKYDIGCTFDFSTINDNNTPTIPPPLNECEETWHPDVKYQQGCTNDKTDYPSDWKTPSNYVNYFFNTAQECCAKYTFVGTCPIRDACRNDEMSSIEITKSPTNKPTYAPNVCKWHPSTNPKNENVPQCDWSDTYPSNWNDPTLSLTKLYDSFDECCQGAHGVSECDRVAYCDTEQPTMNPTTVPPTLSPTTFPPTESPTTNEVSMFDLLFVYFYNPSFDRCVVCISLVSYTLFLFLLSDHHLTIYTSM